MGGGWARAWGIILDPSCSGSGTAFFHSGVATDVTEPTEPAGPAAAERARATLAGQKRRRDEGASADREAVRGQRTAAEYATTGTVGL